MADPINAGDPVRRLMPSLSVSARGMSVQQNFLEVIAKNIANAETTALDGGGPYQRQIATAAMDATGEPVTSVSTDPSPGRKVYDPGHPDSDTDGFVQYPNVDVESEIVDLMLVRRMYEANVTVFQAAKRMLRQALEI